MPFINWNNEPSPPFDLFPYIEPPKKLKTLQQYMIELSDLRMNIPMPVSAEDYDKITDIKAKINSLCAHENTGTHNVIKVGDGYLSECKRCFEYVHIASVYPGEFE